MKTRSTSRPDSGEERRAAAENHDAAQSRRTRAAAMTDARAASLAQLQKQRCTVGAARVARHR